MCAPAAEAPGDRKVHMNMKDMASMPYGVIMLMWGCFTPRWALFIVLAWKNIVCV
jgi:hypothetical protein